MGLTTDHFYLLLIQLREDLNAMRAEPGGVIVNRGLKIEYFNNSIGQVARVLYPLPGPWCTLDRKERGKNWCVYQCGLIFAIRWKRKKEERKEVYSRVSR